MMPENRPQAISPTVTLDAETLRTRTLTVLPDLYVLPKGSGREARPDPMGSAGLKFQPDGAVAWDQMWVGFCDLAMAGGPPHRGTLLAPGRTAEILANSGRYRQVVREIVRGISLTTALEPEPAVTPGWVYVECRSRKMAGWLTRAITMENVSVRLEGSSIHLPASPGYRLEKEIKNVVTVLAKTHHYWSDHMPAVRRESISRLFATMEEESPLIQPAYLSEVQAGSWRAVEQESISAAISMMRALVACNVLARREGTTLYLPINDLADPGGKRARMVYSHLQTLFSASVES